jgi:hypothetical protein
MIPAEWPSVLVSYFVFGTLGYRIGGRLRRPVSSPVLIGIVLLALLACYVGIHTKLICAFGFTIYLNWALQALALGMICSILIRGKASLSTR